MVKLKIGTRHTSVESDIAAARATYERIRDQSGEGASTFPSGVVLEQNRPRIRISYNGRLWIGDKPFGEVA